MENHQDTRNWSVDKERLSAAMQSLASRRGMSLVEIMVVIAIILMLLSVITFGVFQTLGNARQDTTKLTMGKMAQQIEIYMLRKKKTPSSLSDVFTDEDVPKDGWDNEIQLVTPGPGRMKFDLVSYGADGSSGGTGADEDLKWSELKN